MRVLITGGAGYIGTALVSELAMEDSISEIVIYDNLSHGRHGLFFGQPIASTSIRFVRGELLDTRTLQKALKGVDIVLHLAAKVSTPFAQGDPHSFEQINHWGTAELSYLLEESTVEKVIYLSSASVYGLDRKIHSPSDRPNPDTWYGTSKLRGEKMILRLRNKMDVLILRCANVYGYSASMRFDAVINRFLRETHFERKISIEGNGEQRRPFIHIERIAKILRFATLNTVSDDILHAVDDNFSIWEIASHFKRLYPDLEMIFVEQDIHRAGLELMKSDAFDEIPYRSLEANIAEFLDLVRFS